jgi:nucleotide sugar dehydrogenase
VIGLDASAERIRAIHAGAVDLVERDRPRLETALDSGRMVMTTDAADLAAADAVIICVPTPVDERLRPDLRAVRGAAPPSSPTPAPARRSCSPSTTYVGTTRELLCTPLSGRGLEPGRDVHVVFAPERINPGDDDGGSRPASRASSAVSRPSARRPPRACSARPPSACTSSPRPRRAELTKLQENTFRALNLAFANEMAAVAATTASTRSRSSTRPPQALWLTWRTTRARASAATASRSTPTTCSRRCRPPACGCR